MKSTVLLLVIVSTCARVVPVSLYGKAQERIDGEYIVQFEYDARIQFSQFKQLKLAAGLSFHEFGEYMGFGGALSQEELETVQAFPGVKLIEQNQRYYSLGTQTNVQAWGIDRSDQRALPLNQLYQWNENGNGQGVDIFVLDTGINNRHANFNGRAFFAADCVTGFCATHTNPGDPNGHGTHCAGSIASTTYGIAKNSRVFSVRVVSPNHGGSTSTIIAGISYVNNRAGKRVISLTLGGGFSSAFNNAVDASHRAGVVNVASAGNSNTDACNTSPASASLVLTVGATGINDKRAYFSNFGTCVDVFAPGVDILSTHSNGTTAVFSGTSMACSHVVGGIALILSRGNLDADAAVNILIKESTDNAIVNPGTGSPNRLFYTNPTDP